MFLLFEISSFWEILTSIDIKLLYTLSYIALGIAFIGLIAAFFTNGESLQITFWIVIGVLFVEYHHTNNRLKEERTQKESAQSAKIYEKEIYKSDSYAIIQKTDVPPEDGTQILDWRNQVLLNAKKGYNKYKEPKVQGTVINKSNKTIVGIEITAEFQSKNKRNRQNIFSSRANNVSHKELITDIVLKPSQKLNFEFYTLGPTSSYRISWVQYEDGSFDE